jgi:uncharacterized membrane protein YbhN (UPF0104 family)
MTDEGRPAAENEAKDAAPHRKKQPLWKRALSGGITVAVLVAVFGFVLPNLADYRDVLDYVVNISPAAWAVIVFFTVAFLLAYPIVLVQVMATLRLKEAFVNHMAGTAVTNSVPSGGAIALPINYAMYMSWGFTPHAVSAGLLAAGVWDWLARISLPVIAVFGIAVTGDAQTWMWAVSIGGVAIVGASVFFLAKLLDNEGLAQRFADWLDRLAGRIVRLLKRSKPDVAGIVVQFREDLNGVVRRRAWHLSTATVWNHATMTGLFVACVYAVGVDTTMISLPWVILAFTLGRFLVMIPVSPGGLGLVDLGWIGILTLGWQTTNPGVPVDTSLISAGVLLFRALTLLPPIPIGMVSWLFWRSNTSWQSNWRTELRGDLVTDPSIPVAES